MPYLRVYSRGLPIEQKRIMAQKLTEITLRAFQLPAEHRKRMVVQFVTESQLDRLDGHASLPSDADFKLEVIVHHLTESRKKDFGKEAVTIFADLAHPTLWERINRALGGKAASQRVVFQFNELSPAVSDPFVVDQDLLAA